MLTWPLSGVRVAVGFAVAVKAYTAWEPLRKVSSGEYLTIPVVPSQLCRRHVDVHGAADTASTVNIDPASHPSFVE